MPEQPHADEVEQEYVAALGPHLGELFYHLRNDTIWLNLKWQEFTILFGSSPSRVDLLNRAAPAFFRIVQDALWEDALLHIARLTDPPRSAGKDNLTLTRLPELVTPEIRPRVDAQLGAVLDLVEFARDWRRRHIAHRDLALALVKNARRLSPASHRQARQAIEAINALLNTIDAHYRRSETCYSGGLNTGNAEDLLYVLRDGLEAEEERLKRLEAGEPLAEDLAPRPDL